MNVIVYLSITLFKLEQMLWLWKNIMNTIYFTTGYGGNFGAVDIRLYMGPCCLSFMLFLFSTTYYLLFLQGVNDTSFSSLYG